MLCDEKTLLLRQYALAINQWFATLDALHHSIESVPESDYEVFRATALQARDDCQSKRRKLEAHKTKHGC